MRAFLARHAVRDKFTKLLVYLFLLVSVLWPEWRPAAVAKFRRTLSRSRRVHRLGAAPLFALHRFLHARDLMGRSLAAIGIVRHVLDNITLLASLGMLALPSNYVAGANLLRVSGRILAKAGALLHGGRSLAWKKHVQLTGDLLLALHAMWPDLLNEATGGRTALALVGLTTASFALVYEWDSVYLVRN